MAKNQNRKPAKRNDPMGLATTVFLAGCFAEMYLLMIRRYYIDGTLEQVVSWHAALPFLIAAGAVICVIGAVLALKWKSNKAKRSYALWIAGIGAFVALATTLIRLNMSFLSPLTTLIPVAMLLVLVWVLYDRECALTLTILASALVMLWICRRLGNNLPMGTALKLLGIAYILLLIVVAVLVKKGKFPLLEKTADPMPVYVGSALGVITVAIALFSTAMAYYAMWVLAAVVFGLAVYYTVKQL